MTSDLSFASQTIVFSSAKAALFVISILHPHRDFETIETT